MNPSTTLVAQPDQIRSCSDASAKQVLAVLHFARRWRKTELTSYRRPHPIGTPQVQGPANLYEWCETNVHHHPPLWVMSPLVFASENHHPYPIIPYHTHSTSHTNPNRPHGLRQETQKIFTFRAAPRHANFSRSAWAVARRLRHHASIDLPFVLRWPLRGIGRPERWTPKESAGFQGASPRSREWSEVGSVCWFSLGGNPKVPLLKDMETNTHGLSVPHTSRGWQ